MVLKYPMQTTDLIDLGGYNLPSITRAFSPDRFR